MSNDTCVKLYEWYSLAEDLYPFTIGLIVISTVSILPTFILNALILAAIVRTSTLHTPSNILTCNLAAANLGVALICIPVLSTWKLMELYHYDKYYICVAGKITLMVGSSLNAASYLTILFATVDRYLALVLHLRYLSLVTVKRVSKSCVIIWIISFLLMSVLYNGPDQLYTITTGTSMLLLLISIVFCYSQIFTIIRRHHNQIASQTLNNTAIFAHMSRYRKSVYNLLYVVCCQFIFITPSMCCLAVLAACGISVDVVRFWTIGIITILLSPLVNPLLIYMKYGELRIAIIETACYYWTKVKQTF